MHLPLAFLTLLVLAQAQATPPERVIADFEREEEVALVSTEAQAAPQLSAEQVSHGARSLKLILPPGDYPGLSLQVPADWRPYEALRFDLWCERPASLGIRIDDANSTGYTTRYNEESGVVRAGWNHIQIPLDRVARILDLGRVRAFIPFLMNVTQPTTIYLDHVRLGAYEEGYDDRPLPGELGPKKEFTYSTEVVTPHVPWARPLAGGPLKALLITGVATGREVIELAQRLEMDFQVVTIEKSWDVNRWGMGDYYGARGDQNDFRLIYRYLEQALTSQDPFDVIVLPMVHGWNMLTPRTREAVLRRVGGGAGLVLVHPFVGRDGKDRRLWELSPLIDGPDDFFGGGGYVASPPAAFRAGEWRAAGPHFITDGLPLALLPHSRLPHVLYRARGEVILTAGEEPLAAVGEYGRGRVVALGYRNADITPAVEGDGKDEPPYPYYETLYRLVIRAMLWAARREPATRLSVQAERAAVPWTAPAPAFRLRLVGEPLPGATVHVTLGSELGWDRARLETDIPVPDGQQEFVWQPPTQWPLDAGVQVADFRLLQQGKAVDSTTAWFTVESPAMIAALEAPDEPFSEGAEVPVRVRIEGAPPEGSRVRLALVDDHGRELSRADLEAAPVVSGMLTCANVVGPWARVTARLLAGERLLDVRRLAMQPVSRRERQPDDDFHAFMSGVDTAGHPYLRPVYRRRFAEMGAEAGSVFGGDVPNSLNVYGMGVYAYERGAYSACLKQYEQTHDKLRFLVREPCFNDPAWRQEIRERVLAAARAAAPFRPFSYYVADESSITSYTDAADFCFGPHCLSAMREWLREVYGSLERLNAQWGTQFTAWEDVVPDTAEEARARGNDCAWADHRTFMERTFADAFRYIRDCAREVDPQAEISISGTQATVAHNGCDWYRLTRVIKSTGPYTTGDQWELHRSFLRDGRINGWTGYGSSGDGVRHFIWSGLLHGLSSMGIFWQYSCLNPDFTFSQSARDMAVAFREIGAGPGLLLNRLQRDNNGIAIHYSLPSVHAAFITDRQADWDAARHNLTVLLQDLGLQFDFLASEQIETGELARFRCLLLPLSLALSDREAAAIRNFAAKGGQVLRLGPLGERDEHCGRRPRPALEGIAELPADVARYEVLRDSEAGAALRAAVRQLLAGLQARARVVDGAEELIHCERVLFRGPEVEVLALLRDDLGGRRIVGPDGVEYRQEAPGQETGPREITIHLPQPAYVTDMRSGESFDRTDTVRTTIRSAEAKLFALLPYAVRGLRVSAEGAQLQMAVETNGRQPGLHVFHIEVTRPDGAPAPLYARNVVAQSGTAEYTLPFAANDPSGEWTIRVTDVATRQTAMVAVRR